MHHKTTAKKGRMGVWFTSDTHFGHSNIIRLCGRKFNDVHHMNESLIKRWNSVVSKNDEIYHLGDVGYKISAEATEQLVTRLNGKKYLIRGNHDKNKILNVIGKYFEWVKDYHELRIEKHLIVLSHYPFREWNGYYGGSWHLHGHCHSKINGDTKKRIDVGVDCTEFDYTPVSYEKIRRIMNSKPL